MPATDRAAAVMKLVDQAQISMAYSAEQTVYLGIAQFALAAFGTIALLITLRETRRATDAARRSVQAQRAADRAIILVDIGAVNAFLSGDPNVGGNAPVIRCRAFADIKLSNVGTTVAFIEGVSVNISLSKVLPSIPTTSLADMSFPHRLCRPGDNSQDRHLVDIAREDEVAFGNGDLDIWVQGIARYRDVFGVRHHQRFAFQKNKDIPGVPAGDASFWTSDLEEEGDCQSLWWRVTGSMKIPRDDKLR